ncbi:MAG: hypothetical protein P8J91_01330 [Pirellulaceae bacterium]|nr:CpsD/CapB family tyrosine-protein kinase [Planctomycetaceae bacterium]MDG2102362.1 hypothetical protein [Pirellulaceae bacterium]
MSTTSITNQFQNVALSPLKPADNPLADTTDFKIGDKTVRIDPAVQRSMESPHVRLENIAMAALEAPPTSTSWNEGVGVVEMGLGNVVENNQAFQQAAQEASVQAPEGVISRKIQPAWEVDYFRWPRLARRLLQTHQELFDQIGDQVLGDLQSTRSRIGVCSTFQREGKTTLATCLARWSALQGKRTLLIDADIERPKMTLMCGLSLTFGWQSLLETDIPASEAMVRSVESGLVFMPSRVNTQPLISNKSIDRLSMITFQMKYEFDVVVVDMGTIDNICAYGDPDMDVVDAMLVTRDPSRTSLGQVMDTRRVLENQGVKKSYVAQNFTRPQDDS